MSDYTEYAEYYKKAWEKALTEKTKECVHQASFDTYHTILNMLEDLGYKSAAEFLKQNEERFLKT